VLIQATRVTLGNSQVYVDERRLYVQYALYTTNENTEAIRPCLRGLVILTHAMFMAFQWRCGKGAHNHPSSRLFFFIVQSPARPACGYSNHSMHMTPVLHSGLLAVQARQRDACSR
jgi:hypothetical protein